MHTYHIYPTDNALLTRCHLNSSFLRLRFFSSVLFYFIFFFISNCIPRIRYRIYHTHIKSVVTIEKYVMGLAEDTSTMRINVWVSDRNNSVGRSFVCSFGRSIVCYAHAVQMCVKWQRVMRSNKWYVYKLYRWARPTWFVSMSASHRISRDFCIYRGRKKIGLNVQYSCATRIYTNVHVHRQRACAQASNVWM